MKLCAALAVLLLLGACGSESDSSASRATSPEAAVTTFLRALEDGDCAVVKKVVVTPSTVDCEVVQSLKGSYADEGTDLDSLSLKAGEVTGDSAVVDLGGSSDESWSVERIDGAWRVIFDTEE